ncbi:regulator of nucleoside diphosphate kinase [Anaerospora hongkongensis]|uniref:Regulator of nucleoside diphosphate kinase n=1 Tax=Anaerospora hongkongensis TaxID=244830 RepID=A0A4V2Q8N5_9FIRM|nr:nucleoside diphosphate kinase regulator [Anaerospora hongkongensis]TCL37382.1 regulator of nucleoside diphosphate kinase [Anaerospora hongkongensis]
MSRTIFITCTDRERLEKLIQTEEEFVPGSKTHLTELKSELKRAVIVESQAIPEDVITMRSQVLLKDLSSNEEMVCTLVYPDEADMLEGKISVLAPIGMAILGYRENDRVEWATPGGIAQLQIEKILFQPESSGHYDL